MFFRTILSLCLLQFCCGRRAVVNPLFAAGRSLTKPLNLMILPRRNASCAKTIKKAVCTYNSERVKKRMCFEYDMDTGDVLDVHNLSDCKPEKYSLYDCTWLQVRHWRSIEDPPAPYIRPGVERVEPLDPSSFGDGVQVLTDIDDTMKCSGGHRPNGIDDACLDTKPGALYPGVAAFYYYLALGHREPAPSLHLPFPIPLSARPAKLKWAIGLKTCGPEDLAIRRTMCNVNCSMVKCLKGSHLCNCFGLNTRKAKYGNIADYFIDRPKEKLYDRLQALEVVGDGEERSRVPLFEAAGFERMAYSKFVGFRSLTASESFAGRPMVFLGDNGQGDFTAAQMMLRFNASGHNPLKAAFIHYVRKDMADTPGEFDDAQAAWAQKRIFLFRHYKEAAHLAYTNHLISKANYDRFEAIYTEEVQRGTHKDLLDGNEPDVVEELSSDDVDDECVDSNEERAPEEPLSADDKTETDVESVDQRVAVDPMLEADELSESSQPVAQARSSSRLRRWSSLVPRTRAVTKFSDALRSARARFRDLRSATRDILDPPPPNAQGQSGNEPSSAPSSSGSS